MGVEKFLVLAPMISGLYRKVALPAALVCIIQGIIYGIFSKWGFKEFKWVLVKWIMVIFVVLFTRMGGIGQMFMILENVQKKYSKYNIKKQENGFYIYNRTNNIIVYNDNNINNKTEK
ncbi:MAG: hypothetical protein LBD18_05750 [Treponema sp.]|jgi:hypothetical protein|nr:hypothetical protein [Treponema sp.]